MVDLSSFMNISSLMNILVVLWLVIATIAYLSKFFPLVNPLFEWIIRLFG
jgi:hypothetical protein